MKVLKITSNYISKCVFLENLLKEINNDDSVEISETALLDFLKNSPLPGHRDTTVSGNIYKKSVT